MKNELENIDEVFKQAFDGFEANVDPSVWTSIQSSIGSSAASSVASGVVGKSIALKIVAGVVAVGAITTGAYFVSGNLNKKSTVLTENKVVSEIVDDEQQVAIENAKEEFVEGNIVIEDEKASSEEKVQINEDSTEDKKSQSDLENQQTNKGEVEVENQKAVENDAATDGVVKKVASEKAVSKTTVVAEKDAVINLSVNINVDNIKGKAPLTVQFDALGENAETYFWDFRDGSEKVNGDAPVHVFEEEGTYRVVLTGIDKNGNSKDAHKTIVVEKDYSSSLQKLPNVFSPNGDGQNDFVKVRGKNIENIQVQITDTKGNPVYFMNSLDDVWDGKDQSGNYLVQGQYLIVVVAVGTDGEKHVQKQVINLLE